jgi:hypothetical protein
MMTLPEAKSLILTIFREWINDKKHRGTNGTTKHEETTNQWSPLGFEAECWKMADKLDALLYFATKVAIFPLLAFFAMPWVGHTSIFIYFQVTRNVELFFKKRRI